jgi:putative peptidoglycan lipid II flippase
MAIGSVAVLQFDYNLQSVPLTIIGMSYSVAAFPTLAELLAQEKKHEFNAYVLTALRHIMFWSLPVVTLVVVLRAQIVRVLLGSGSFDWSDTRLTAAVLGLFVLSLVGQSILLLLVRAFYAGGHTRTPLLLTLIGTGIGSLSAYGFYVWFTHSVWFQSLVSALFRLDTVSGTEVLMLPLGFTIGTLVQMVMMLVMMSRTFQVSFEGMGRHLCVSLGASLVGGCLAYLTLISS